MAAACDSLRELVQKMRTVSSTELFSDNTLDLLRRLHNCASAVGFLSLATSAASYHDSIAQGTHFNLSTIAEALSDKLHKAEAEWDGVKSNIPMHMQLILARK